MAKTQAKAAVVGIGQSRLFRRAEVPLGVLAVEACQRAIEDAGLTSADIDGIAAVPRQPFEGAGSVDGLNFVTPGFVVRALNLDVSWGQLMDTMVGHSMVEAINAVAAGACQTALVYRALHNPEGRYGRTAPTGAAGSAQFSAPYGIYPPGVFALSWQRYNHKYGRKREEMAPFIVNNRKNALMWEFGYWAQYRPEALSVEDYLNSRMISDPVCIYDCDIPVQGCGAFVITTAERARSLRQPPAYVLGAVAPIVRPAGTVAGSLEGAQEAAGRLAGHLWANTGLSAEDMDVANLYDGFSFITPLWVEAMGFAKEGEAFDFMRPENIAIDGGKMPLNTSSGNLGTGRLHGVPHIMDGAMQVMGRSGPRQVTDAELSLVVVGPQGLASGMVFSKTSN